MVKYVGDHDGSCCHNDGDYDGWSVMMVNSTVAVIELMLLIIPTC